MNVPTELRYLESHEWIQAKGDALRCGITDYAQQELSDVVFVELPEIGKKIKKGDTLCVVESVKAASDIYAPVSGVVKSVNDQLNTSPELINKDAYGEGWICTLEPSDPAEVDSLLTADAYSSQIGVH